MRKFVVLPTVVVTLLALSTAVYAADCTCATDKTENGWCQHCDVGYFAGVRIHSEKLYDALEGKTVAETSKVKCPACKAAIENDGRCGHCKVGFVNKTRYASNVAYRLARGKVQDPAKIKCTDCQAHANDRGWCDTCKVGFAGNRAFKDKEVYKDAVKARDILRAAAKAAKKCETCAVAMVTDGSCATCKVSYRDGKKITKTKKKQTPPEKP